jgi:hypothetical protein
MLPVSATDISTRTSWSLSRRSTRSWSSMFKSYIETGIAPSDSNISRFNRHRISKQAAAGQTENCGLKSDASGERHED